MSEVEGKDQDLAQIESDLQKKIQGYIVKDKAIDVDRAKAILSSLKGIVNKVVDAVAKELDKRQAEIVKMKTEIEKIKIAS